MTALARLEKVPALIAEERAALALLTKPSEVRAAERRAAAIAELAKRAGLAVPIQNEATFLHADARKRLAVLVDEGQAAGEIHRHGTNRHTSRASGSEPLPIPAPRLNEARALAETNALEEAEKEAAKHPDKPVSMDSILKRAKRGKREKRLREERERQEETARCAIAAAAEPPFELLATDMRDWRPEGVSAIVTDPPYVGDSIPLYEALRDFALAVLPDGGPLVVMTWQAILPDVIQALAHPGLGYRWTICWRFANTENTADHARRVFDCWKPVLVYHKGAMPVDAPMIRDEIANQATDKDYHEWGQSVSGFERLVRSFSAAGETICDPFLGGGTTAVAALALHRRFVGCDVSADAVATTRARLAA